MSAQATVYIDTNVFIYQLFPQNQFLHSKAKRFFYDIQNGRYRGVTSSFTRTEFFAVMKESLANQTRRIPTQASMEVAMKTLDNFIDQMGIELFDSDHLANKDGKLFAESWDRVEKSFPSQGRDGDWRGLNGADALVLLFAERTRADKIATNDDGFKNNSSPVSSLIIREVY